MNQEFLTAAYLEFIEDGADKEDQAFASISLNPNFQWAKIIVTDDKPNSNKQRIPQEEFDNLIKTGIHSPIKMQPGKPLGGHKAALGYPIGTITALRKVDNRVEALAALWKQERPEDIETLKEMYAKGTPPNVSWELSYDDSDLEEGGVKALKNIILDGLCVVGMPAYAGRTPFIAMASKDLDNKDNDNMEQELQEKLDKLQTEFDAKIAELTAKEADLTTLKSELDDLKTQNTALAEFKTTVETEKALAEKLVNVKQKFSDAKLERDEEYFEQNKDRFLKMSDEDLDFHIQDLVAFSNKAQASDNRTSIPNLRGNPSKMTPSQLAEELKKATSK